MDIDKYLFKYSKEDQDILINNNEYKINFREKDDFIIYSINNNCINIFKNRWSEIHMKDNYNENIFFYDFIEICEKINIFYRINICIYNNNLPYITTEKILKKEPHPIDKYKFKADKPDFPFTLDTNIIASNCYYYDKAIKKLIIYIRSLNLEQFIKFINDNSEKEPECCKMLLKSYGCIDSKIGDFVDFAVNLNQDFYIMMEDCLNVLEILPKKYIKIY